MVKRKDLLQAVDKDLQSLSAFISECQTTDVNCLSEIIGSCSKKEIEHIWLKTHQLVENTLQQAIQDDLTLHGVSSELSKVLHDMVAMLAALLSQKEIFVPDSALLVADLLNKLIGKLPSTDHKLRNMIAKLFEDWWKKSVTGSMDFIINSFSYIIERSLDLQPKPLVTDVRRVWCLHEVLSLIDLEMQDSSFFCNLLLRCFICPHYLRQDEGRKFLGYILSENEQFTITAHKAIKQHLINLNSSMHGHVGEVYFRAWQNLQERGVSLKFEQECIQDFMYHAALAQPVIFPALKKVLSYFHNHKKTRGVDEMLLRLYEPFLWRCLNSVNYQVRENSLQLFFDVFPLNNPDDNVVERDKMLKLQFGPLEELLKDPVQSVQALAVTGVFNVLNNCWDMIPLAFLKKLLSHMLKSLSSVKSSAEVRENVIKGLTVLLDNVLSHVFLQPLLPELQKSVHDVSEKVRIAMLELLLKVKRLRKLKYWHIVPQKHLLARLTVDTDAVNRRIVKLLDCFLPLQNDSDVQVERCIVLLEENPAAARQYFRYAQHNMNIKDTVNYMLSLCKALIADMLQKRSRATEDDNDDSEENKEETEEERPEVDLFTDAVVLGILETICILWASSTKTLKKESNASLEKELQKKFCFALEEMMRVYTDPKIVTVVVQIAGFMPIYYVPKMSRTWVPKLRAMTCDNNPEDYAVLLETLCSCNRGPEVIELVTEWIQAGLAEEAGPKSAKRKKKRVGFIDPVAPQPQLALDFLCFIFQNTLTREKFLQSHMEECVKLRDLLKKCMGAIERKLKGSPDNISVVDEKFLKSALSVYCQLIILIHFADPETYPCSDAVVEVIQWADKHVLPTLCMNDQTGQVGASKQHRQLAIGITEGVLKFQSNLLLTGYADAALCSQIVKFCYSCVTDDDNLELLASVLINLCQVTDSLKFIPEEECQDEESPKFNSSVIPTTFGQIIKNICVFVREHPEQSHKLLSCLKTRMLELMKAIFKDDYSNDTITHDIMGTISGAILANMKNQSEQLNLEEEASLGSLPPLSNWLITIIQRQTAIYRSLVEDLQTFCGSEAMTDLHSLHGLAHILCALATGPKMHKELKDLYEELDKQTSTMLKAMSDEEKEENKETVLLVELKSEKIKALLHIKTPVNENTSPIIGAANQPTHMIEVTN